MGNKQKFEIEQLLKLSSVEMAFEASYDSGFYFAGETHPFWEMVYVQDGIVDIAADDRIYELSKNEVVFHRPGEFHRIWSHPNSSSKLFIILFHLSGNTKPFEQLVFKLSKEQKNNLDAVIECLKETSDTSSDIFSNGVRTYFLSPKLPQLVGNLFEIYLLSLIYSTLKTAEKKHDKSSLLYKKIIETMNDNLYSNITVEEIAQLCHISVSGLKKNFKKYSGTSIHRYFIILKIYRATQFLQTDMSLSEISDKLNFDNQNYFSTVFKRVVGVSPSEFRKKDINS